MFKRKNDGSYEIDTKIKVNGVYKHFHKSGYTSLGAAKADFIKAKEQFIIDNTTHHSANTFNELFQEYEQYRAYKVDRSTIMTDESINKIYFKLFNNRYIKDVFNEKNISYWYHDLVNSNKSNTRKSIVITRLKDILKFAYQHKYIDAMVYQDCDVLLIQVKYNKKPLTERVAWSMDEEIAFLNATKENDRDYLMFRLFLSLGCRLGEFLALMPKSIDFIRGKININQQVKPIKQEGAVLTSKLKTNESYRSILLDDHILNELKNYILTMDLSNDDYLFFSYDKKNEPLGRNTFRRKLKYYCKKANVRLIHPHCIRHTLATRLATNCHNALEINAAARILGHSPSMFVSVYSNHISDEIQKDLLDKINCYK